MAQGDPFQLGVAHFLHNHSFRHTTRKATTLSGNYTSGLTLNVNTTTPALNSIFKAGDRISIGPSSDADDEGQVETRIIAGVSTNTFTLRTGEALTYDYSSGDDVWGYGSALAGGWTPTNLTPGGIDIQGYDDNYSQKISSASTDGTLYQNFAVNLRASTYYRAGLYYITSGIATSDLLLKVYDGASNFINATVATADQATFALFTAVGQCGASPSGGYYMIYMDFDSPDNFTAYIDCIFLEHATDTDDEASGVYTFDEQPDMGTTRYRQRPFYKSETLANNTMRWFDPTGTGSKATKWEFSCHFTYAAKAFLDQLLILKRWQDDGNLLTFHPNTDSIPPVLIGRMEVFEDTEIGEPMWNKDIVSFGFIFREA